ncbi:ThuA domain-containing protein [Dyadobacter sp. LHD-138]|uniref:ThuA domain-containing protein n=1 Tax=Dyadobacter sp. LHD-138 TaxID=3071413 RepID=UPI0027DFAB29|nr:ThuA domain-containing protein [Dyadobacter sp. LHD-138]MDQ6482020.1 ThuA domain-containing protein [Dyadobacter sp. LHD-138]
MKKIITIVFRCLLGLVVLTSVGTAIFIYKITYGFPVSYETEKPVINFPQRQPAILVFSKTTAFRHSESIEASKSAISEMARRNKWFIYETEAGGIFNLQQLAHFKVVVFNNVTGRVLNEQQHQALSKYIENGGSLVGIHGAGDNSHHWPWYEKYLIGARFSHHSLSPHLQKAVIHLQTGADTLLTNNLPHSWNHTDEWYVFFNKPKEVHVAAYINGNSIKPSGNLLWIRDKNFGMGSYHPVAWYRRVHKGKTFYTSMGHSAEAWKDTRFLHLIENGLRWSIQ